MTAPHEDGAATLRREAWIVSLALALITFVVGAGSWTWRIDQTLYDAGLRLTGRAASPDIVIVAVDDESLAAIGRWPWRRAVHATLIDKLAGVGTRALGLDLLLSEADPDPAQDKVLGEAIRRAGNVVLPVAFLAGPDGVRELLPVPALREGAHLGHVDAELDADSILRAAFLRAGPGAPTRPHFALALLRAAHEPPPAPPVSEAAPPHTVDRSAWQRDERRLIRYTGAPGNVARVPFVHLLRGDVAPETLRGKYVLIGATAIGVGDAFATPVSGRERPMPGIEITANLLDNLRTGTSVQALPPRWEGGFAALLAAVLIFLMQRLRPRTALVLCTGLALVLFPASVLLLAAGRWIAPTPFAVAALLAYPLWSWRRLEAANRFFERELVRLHGGLTGTDTAAPEAGDQFAARIATLRLAADRLEASQRLVAETLAALPEAVFVTRRDGRVEFANPRALALAGAPDLAAAKLQPLGELLRGLVPHEQPTWTALLQRAEARRATVVTEAHGPAHGDFLVRCAPLCDAGALLGDAPAFVVALADVTRLKTAERQRDEVLAFVSHDIRSPQASLLSLVEMRREGQLEIDEGTLLGYIEDLARRSLALADEFVQVARAEAKALKLEDVEPARLLDEALAEVRPQAQSRQVELAGSAAADLPPLRVEKSLVARALGNLLNNAVKFSPQGGRVVAAVSVREDCCVFSIQDRGPGIAQEDVGRLFQRYHRVESGSTLRLLPGVGLGLVFVDAVARRHGGRVSVESRVGEGACFELIIPLAGAATRI